jgi:hypothetical protein
LAILKVSCRLESHGQLLENTYAQILLRPIKLGNRHFIFKFLNDSTCRQRARDEVQRWSSCPAHMKPWIWAPGSQKKKKKDTYKLTYKLNWELLGQECESIRNILDQDSPIELSGIMKYSIDPCCPIWKPLTRCSYRPLEMWVVWLRNWTLNFKLIQL